MGFVPKVAATVSQRHSPNGLWGVDYMEASIFNSAKRIFDFGRIRIYGALREIRHYHSTIRAWAIIGIVTPTGTAGFQILATKGHW